MPADGPRPRPIIRDGRCASHPPPERLRRDADETHLRARPRLALPCAAERTGHGEEVLLGKRRRKGTGKRRTSSADLRFTFVLLVVVGIVLVLGSALVTQLRAAEWTSATISGGVILALVAVTLYSVFQRRA